MATEYVASLTTSKSNFPLFRNETITDLMLLIGKDPVCFFDIANCSFRSFCFNQPFSRHFIFSLNGKGRLFGSAGHSTNCIIISNSFLKMSMQIWLQCSWIIFPNTSRYPTFCCHWAPNTKHIESTIFSRFLISQIIIPQRRFIFWPVYFQTYRLLHKDVNSSFPIQPLIRCPVFVRLCALPSILMW